MSQPLKSTRLVCLENTALRSPSHIWWNHLETKGVMALIGADDRG